MEQIAWTPVGTGTATADPDREGATQLVNASVSTYERFNGEPVPTDQQLTIELHIPDAADYFGLYIDVSTPAGRRQFKFEPNGAAASLKYGYRYSVGLDEDLRGGAWTTVQLDLPQIARTLEPAVTITSIDALYFRVRGRLSVSTEAGTPPPPPPPPPSGDIGRVDAVRFLNQATFGASEASIAELQSLGSYEAWIDEQLALPYTATLPKAQVFGNSSNRGHRHRVWWDNAMNAPDQLRQRLAFAFSELFVVSDLDYTLGNAQWAMCDYYDMLATGASGDFRRLLENVTLHPVMGVYLSMLRSEKTDPSRNIRPDENYAREVMQLFTIGLHELNADGTVRSSDGMPTPAYDQKTVENFAEVFTGWSYADHGWTANNIDRSVKREPMAPFNEHHEPSAKTLLNGKVTAAGATAPADMKAALDNIFAHKNVGPFFARTLIQRFVTSNPSAPYVQRVAARFNDNGRGDRGDLAAVIKAVLLDDEARNGHLGDRRFGKFKEPLLRLTQVWRAFDAEPGPEAASDFYRVYGNNMQSIEAITGQAPLKSPSVFNFFSPFNSLSQEHDLLAPEMEILTEVLVAATNNVLFSMIYDFHNHRTSTNAGDVTRINVDRAMALVNDPPALVVYLDELLNAGSTPSNVRTAIADQVARHPATAEGRLAATLDAVFCIAAGPFHLVQR